MMLLNIFYILLAVLGLGFLVFIHELGHYMAAKTSGMKIEVFSIGFGPILCKWTYQKVQWQLCLFPCGGYVKIAGMEQQGSLEPHQIPHGFYGKSPFKRIGVALAGPVVNIAFTLFAFTLIWLLGGQSKPFQEMSRFVGFVETTSSLNEDDVKPGDVLYSFNNKPFDGYADLLMKTVLTSSPSLLKGAHLNYLTSSQTPFTAQLPAAQTPHERVDQLGILPAQHLIIDQLLTTDTPLLPNDRLLWANGTLLFSQKQLSSVLKEQNVFLTLKRNNALINLCIPKVKIEDLRLSSHVKDELEDWNYALGLCPKLGALYFIPYHISSSNKVETPLFFMNQEAEEVTLGQEFLKVGDEIIAVNGRPAPTPFDLFQAFQNHEVLLVAQHTRPLPSLSWQEANQQFEASFKMGDLLKLTQSLSSPSPLQSVGDLQLITAELKPFIKLNFTPELKAQIEMQYALQKQEIEKIDHPEERQEQLDLLEQNQHRLSLGVILKDQTVTYNPLPTSQFMRVFHNALETLFNFFTGSLTPKAMSGPVGIVQALQHSFATSSTDALFWLGFVSLNLAVLNLLPIPVLDGGHIVFALIELITKKPLRAKTMEKWVIPFLVLFMILFVYLTYQDIMRLLRTFF
ncbi:MAG: site-2 protease family protein [Candidatus Rhabdochlamydia sp.]